MVSTEVENVKRQFANWSQSTPEFTKSNDFYTNNIIGQTLLLVIATFFVSIKCIVRKGYLGVWTAEDWLIVISWALLVVLIAFSCLTVAHGGGMNESDLSAQDKAIVLYLDNVTTIIYSFETFFSKTAVLLTYVKIFTSGSGSRDWWMIIGMIIANGLFYGITAFLKIFACSPRQKIWLPDTAGFCKIDQAVILTTTGVWNVLSDIAVLTLPAIFVWRLKLKAETKWQIIIIFTLGAISYPILSIIGLVMRILWAYHTSNQTYFVVRLCLFAEAEIVAGLVCACIPSIFFMIRRIQNRNKSYTEVEQRKIKTLVESSPKRNAGGGPVTQHLDVALDDPETRPPDDAFMPKGKWLSRNSLYSGKNETTIGRSRDRTINGMDVVAELAGDCIWKTTEVSVSYDPRKTPQHRSRANSSERIVVDREQVL